MKLFQQKCDSAGAECAIVTLSNPIQVLPLADVRNQFLEEHQLEHLFYPDDRMRKFFEQNHLKYLQLARQFRSDVDSAKTSVYYHGFDNTKLGTGHWNEAGHARAAELILKFIVNEFLN